MLCLQLIKCWMGTKSIGVNEFHVLAVCMYHSSVLLPNGDTDEDSNFSNEKWKENRPIYLAGYLEVRLWLLWTFSISKKTHIWKKLKILNQLLQSAFFAETEKLLIEIKLVYKQATYLETAIYGVTFRTTHYCFLEEHCFFSFKYL